MTFLLQHTPRLGPFRSDVRERELRIGKFSSLAVDAVENVDRLL